MFVPLRVFLLSLLVLFLFACGGAGGPGEVTTTQFAAAESASSEGLGATSNAGASAASDSTLYTIRAIAGVETGLVRLASLDDTIAAFRRDNVIVDYSSGARPRSQQGLLYNCSGAGERRDCDVFGKAIFDEPGTYSYSVTYDAAGIGGGEVTLTGGRIIVEPPGDFVIVSVGDSVASGEGSPEVPVVGLQFDGGYWDDVASDYNIPGIDAGLFEITGCHRSSFAGPALAARRIADTNDVTFVHIACTGAKLGLIQQGDLDFPGYDYGWMNKVDTQLHWVRERFGRIDVLLVSAGANNVSADGETSGFGQVVTACLKLRKSLDCDQDPVKGNISASIGALPAFYRRFADLINTGTGTGSRSRDCPPDDIVDDQGDTCSVPREPLPPEQVPSVVAITEYFDPTRDEDGDFPTDAESLACTGRTITQDEWRFLYTDMVVPLNQQVAAAATLHDWVLVDGIADAFRTHGYCSSPGLGDGIGDSWVVKVPESLNTQGDEQGSAHPDKTGQQVYRDKIYAKLLLANPPRTRATATTEGETYEFGTWVNTDVEVTLMAYNPIREAGVSATYYAIGEPVCTPDTVDAGSCQAYSMPFMVTESGRNVVSFYSLNDSGAPETKAEPVEVLIDRTPPQMTCTPTPAEVWPPNKKMVPVTVEVTAVDEVSGPADWWLSSIADSYDQAGEAISGFEIDTADTEGEVIADRRGDMGARYYTLTYSSVDHIGNVGTCDAVVTVPHDQRSK